MDVQVSQSKGGERGCREDNLRRDRAGSVRSTLGAVRVDYHKFSNGAVEEPVRCEKVKRHDVPPVKKPRQEGNS